MALFADTDPLLLAYVVLFAAAAIACFASVGRARRIEDRDTRLGILALLVSSGVWSVLHVAFLVAPTPTLQARFYLLGLVVGLGTVGPWLYFCSAYTGRSLHRNTHVRQFALAAYLVVVAVKVTNPFHELYFTGEVTMVPFQHLEIHTGVLHWSVMGVSYALAAIGYFMLLELFLRVGHDTKPLAVLIGITGLPILFDLAGFASPLLIDITYEPIGVAVFAVGICFVYLDRFQAVKLAGDSDEPVIVLNDAGAIRDYNTAAAKLFPELSADGVIGEPIEAVLDADDHLILADEDPVVGLERNGETRYFQVTSNPFGSDSAAQGRQLSLTDVTHRERYRRELERQNERLDQFASMLSHDLRNPLNVASGRLELIAQEVDHEQIDAIEDAHERMEEMIEDVLSLARQGQPIDEMEPVSLLAIAEESWALVDTGDATLRTGDDCRFMADDARLQQLLENLFRNAIDHVGDDVTVTVTALASGDGFAVSDDGPGIPPDERDDVFGSGYTTAEEGTGFGLAIVSEIVDAHGWSIAVTEGDAGGARFEVTDVDCVD